MGDDLAHDVLRLGELGDGIIELPGGSGATEHIPGALPGDRVRRRDSGGWTIEPSARAGRRAAALCPHVPACGGCRVQHLADGLYTDWKASLLSQALRRQGVLDADSGDSALQRLERMALGSRRRAVLTGRRESRSWVIGFHEAQSHALIAIEACAVLTPAIVTLLPGFAAVLAACLPQSTSVRITVLDTGAGFDVALEPEPRRKRGGPPAPDFARLVAASRILRLTIDGETILQRAPPTIRMAGVAIVPPPGAFVQAVEAAEARMAALAVEAIRTAKARRVADLFSGLGPFTFALARHARVLAVDSERALIEAQAAATRTAQGLKPIETKVRDLYRDPLSPKELSLFDAVVMDPPRAGARAQAEALARSSVPTVVMVSCNPQTLARDLATLTAGGYRLRRVVPIDQFLFTPHLEAVAVLDRA